MSKLFVIKMNGLFGVYTNNGEVYIPCGFTDIKKVFKHNQEKPAKYAFAINCDGKYGLISKENKMLLPFVFDTVEEVEENFNLD